MRLIKKNFEVDIKRFAQFISTNGTLYKANWYFDFISPYAYLQNLRLNEFSRELELERKPLVFAGLLNHWGYRGPVEIEA